MIGVWLSVQAGSGRGCMPALGLAGLPPHTAELASGRRTAAPYERYYMLAGRARTRRRGSQPACRRGAALPASQPPHKLQLLRWLLRRTASLRSSSGTLRRKSITSRFRMKVLRGHGRGAGQQT